MLGTSTTMTYLAIFRRSSEPNRDRKNLALRNLPLA